MLLFNIPGVRIGSATGFGILFFELKLKLR